MKMRQFHVQTKTFDNLAPRLFNVFLKNCRKFPQIKFKQFANLWVQNQN